MTKPLTEINATANRVGTRLARKLAAGQFVYTVETTPPVSAAAKDVLDRVAPLGDLADAINVTDGAGARAHMSALAAAAVLARHGIDPILQFTVRDRNRLALQGDMLGAAALGIRHILCLHGDDVATGDQPEARMVHDLDSRGLMATAKMMRDDGCLPPGRRLLHRPALLIGAADTPSRPGPDWSADGLRRKIAAGASFFQTQFCFEPDVAAAYMNRLTDEGITEQAAFIIGIGPLKSARSARWMNETLWGVHVPEPVIERLERARDPVAEGVQVCCELIEAYRAIPGIAGVHIMGPRVEDAGARVIRDSAGSGRD